jgi:hypothetical protein
MFDKETQRKMCEYEYSISLIGEMLIDFAGRKETALERAHRIWGMTDEESEGTRAR